MNHAAHPSFAAAFALLLSAACLVSAAEPIADPIPAKIQPSQVTVALEPVADGFVAPITLVAPDDGSERLFVVDQPGQVWIVKDGKRLDKPYLDVSESMVKLKPGFDERGLVGFALHNDFAAKGKPGYGRIYTWTSEPVDEGKPHFSLDEKELDSQMVLCEYRVDDHASNTVDLASRRELMRIDDAAWNHNGAPLLVIEGELYIGIGDGGVGNDTGPGHGKNGNGQNIENPFSTVLRIDPLGKTGDKPYGIPADNPFVGKAGMDEIYAYGIRNPWGMSYDAPTKRIVVADVGQAKIEEVNILQSGGNYGWSDMEGTFAFIRNADDPNFGQITAAPADASKKYVAPVVQYDHDEGSSITGGYVYRGKALPQLVGKYVFGDWKHPTYKPATGRFFVADLDTGAIEELLVGGKQPGVFVRGFGVDTAGEIYLLSSTKAGPSGATGAVHRIAPAK